MIAVWYHAIGCLPDTEDPEFTGTVEEAVEWLAQHEGEYVRPDVDGDTYTLSITYVED